MAANQRSDRTPNAVAAGPDPDALRTAYLELLKLCLCDLAGTGTTSVWTHTDGTLLSRELAGEELKIRATGVDWPLHGVTMVGLDRLDDLQSCVETVVRDGVEGDLIEAGTWRGGASILMRATLDALGASERTVWVADSFQGFPAEDADHPDHWRLAGNPYLSVAVEQVEANFRRLGYQDGVRFVPGFFEDTLPALTDNRWALVRLDADSYEATWIALQSLYPRLAVGGFLVIDDYALEECRRAIDEFRAAHGITEPIEEVDWTSVRWRRTSAAEIAPAPAAGTPAAAGGRSPAVPVERDADVRVVSVHERAVQRDKRNLERELAGLRERLAAAEAEVAALHGSPLRGPKFWLGERLARLRR
jgi:Macrocin-O-methyltransferase (TylF)